MESLKRKLSTTRRPSTADRNLLPELNQYKQNNAALQTQISSLMAKLNESKKSEKALKATLQDVEKRCEDAKRKTSEAEELASSARALQNTIDHLENRLEIANTEKLDAQEELFNMRALKSPFDASFPELQDAHESMDTVFSSDSYTERRRDSGATVAQYIAHMEHLQDDVRHKDAYIADLEGNCDQLRQMLDHVNQQYDEMSEQFDMQNELVGKTEESDAQIEQLRTAVVDREVVIAEKEKSVRAVEKQLEHHKLLLHAEIRKHATTSRYLSDDSNPLPELSSLATKKEIDGWIQKLHQRLRKVKPMSPARAPATAAEAQIEDLRNEIDFYVREIIYYKLDIRGYKSDIKKLNKVMAQLGSYGNRSDLDSDTSSLRPAPTPRTRFTSTPELKASERPSPAQNGIVSANMASVRALTPPLSTAADSTSNSPTLEVRTASDSFEEAASRIPIASQASTKITIINPPTTNVIQRHDTQRSLSDSTFQMYKSAAKADEPSASAHDDHAEMLALAMGHPGKPFIHAVKLERMSNSSRPTIERTVSETATVRPVIPMSKFSRDAPFNPHTTAPQQVSRPRAGSGSSVLTYSVQTQSTSPRTERHVSGTSSTSVPFVIAMASPHNPAIAVAAKNMPATRSHKPNSSTSRPTSRAGLDGTMASSTPLPSPASFRSTSPMTANPSTGYKRRLSLSFRKQENQTPATPTHSRSLSGGSIRTAIRWTKGSGRDKEKDVQVRKDSAQPLGSPMEWQDIGLEKD